MKRIVRPIFFVCLLLLAVSIQAMAATTAQAEDSLIVKISYVADSSDAYVFLPNHAAIDEMQDSLTYLRDVVRARIIGINIIGSTSPEGRSERNDELSTARAYALLHIFGLDSLDASRITISQKKDTWHDIACNIVEDGWKFRGSVLPIIMRNDLTERQKEWRLRQLGPEIWKNLDQNYLSKSRYASMVVKYRRPGHSHQSTDSLRIVVPMSADETDGNAAKDGDAEQATSAQQASTAEQATSTEQTQSAIPDEQPIAPIEQPAVEQRQVHISLKTNALTLVAGIANLGFETGFGQFSLDVPVQYSPYTISPKHNLRLLSVQPELRWWLGKEAMKGGHFIGIHGHAVGFNVRMANSMRYQDPNRAAWGLGIGYGYQMPLTSKNDKWMVEFNVGVGYADILYDVYDEGNTKWYIYTGRKHWFGPTRLGIKLSYRFDIDTKKKQKEVAEK